MHLHGSSQQEISQRALPTGSVSLAGLNHWAAPYIGKPYAEGGRGPDFYDCWGLLYVIYRDHFGILIPRLQHILASTALVMCKEVDQLVHEDWIEVEKPFDGCGVAMSQKKAYHHVGIFVNMDGGRILHCYEGQTTVIESIIKLRLKGFKRIAFYRHRLWPTS